MYTTETIALALAHQFSTIAIWSNIECYLLEVKCFFNLSKSVGKNSATSARCHPWTPPKQSINNLLSTAVAGRFRYGLFERPKLSHTCVASHGPAEENQLSTRPQASRKPSILECSTLSFYRHRSSSGNRVSSYLFLMHGNVLMDLFALRNAMRRAIYLYPTMNRALIRVKPVSYGFAIAS